MVNGKDIEIEIINRIISKDYFLISKVKKKSSKKQEMCELETWSRLEDKNLFNTSFNRIDISLRLMGDYLKNF